MTHRMKLSETKKLMKEVDEEVDENVPTESHRQLQSCELDQTSE